MGGIEARHIGIILRQIGDDGFAVHPFKEIIALAVRRSRQIEIPGAHAQGPQPLADDGIRSQNVFGGEHRFGLLAVFLHDFEPAYVLFRPCVVQDMRPVHHAGGMKRGGFVGFVRRDDQPAVLPIIQVCGTVAAHAPMPDAVLSVGLFLVFAVPVIAAVHGQNTAAVGLDGPAVGIQPLLAGIKSVLHDPLLLCKKAAVHDRRRLWDSVSAWFTRRRTSGSARWRQREPPRPPCS